MLRSTGCRCTARRRSPSSSIIRAATAPSSRRNIGTRANRVRSPWSTAKTPHLFIAGFEYLPDGQSEYDFAGSIKDAPLEVLSGPVTGLPLPAYAESILEGELLPPSKTTLPEGPFGEFTGYYAARRGPASVMHGFGGRSPRRPDPAGVAADEAAALSLPGPFRAASIWSNLETIGVSDVVGVWQHVAQLMTVVAVRQRYAGHAKRAALIAAANSYMGRVIVVVDDDVDPSNLADVMWAVTTRSELAEQINGHRAQRLELGVDPRIPDEAKRSGITSHSKAIIEAVRPFGWKDHIRRPRHCTAEEAREIEVEVGQQPSQGGSAAHETEARTQAPLTAAGATSLASSQPLCPARNTHRPSSRR